MTTRLQLGTSRLEKLTQDQLNVFLDRSWLHLGEEKLENPNNRPLIRVDYSKTNFLPFYFRKGNKLDFEDKSYEFVFSEHFFEHLYFDEAIDLFFECNRILKPHGAMRVVVPDADLRPVPEKVGFPGEEYGWNHPRKHKTRWSIYSLSSALKMAKFEVFPIKNYFSDGSLNDLTGNLPLTEYKDVLDIEMLSSISYIKRRNSLIVDAIKK